MTLLSMLIALIIERLAVRSARWQLVSYLRPYLHYADKPPFSIITRPQAGLLLWCLLPALLITVFMLLVDFWLFSLLVNTLVLLLCMGCWHYRQLYKQYLNAAARDDQQAAFLAMQQIETDAGISAQQLSYGQRLVWLNFKYYAAVLFWFAVFGAFGALLYAILRLLAEPATYISSETENEAVIQSEASAQTNTTQNFAADMAAPEVTQDATQQSAQADTEISVTAADIDLAAEGQHEQTTSAAEDLQQLSERTQQLSRSLVLQQRLTAVASDLSHWADWLPARLFGLGFALVGHFSRASAILLSYLGDSSTQACQVLTDIAKAAEPLPEELLNCSTESCSLVQLSKRNILFFLALVAILTLSGALG
ncbi:regulatory signaling modulator protein AmpE [Rheinheimera sp.]|uniref:regulatory signaling modulator protein AmpE n=1 Tax=Rheinheimera sp. TaxID=1869214 RepID=UPI0027B96E0E|nr:regulatory signaling modulator protein AmpE [Rheinheimera sp.]